MKQLKTLPSGSGRDAVPREFQNLEWLNPHIAHRPSCTNLRLKLPAGTVESSSSPRSDNEDDFVAEVSDESEEIVILSTTDDSIQTESP